MTRITIAIAALLAAGVATHYATRQQPGSERAAPVGNPGAATSGDHRPTEALPHTGERRDSPQIVSSIPIEHFRPDTSGDARIPEEQRSIALPDGSRVPVLNGAYGAPDMVGSWPDDRPWSPIVRIDTDSFGKQWYVHADESRSQTVIARFRQSGDESTQAMTLVYTPIEGEVERQNEVSSPDGDVPAGNPRNR